MTTRVPEAVRRQQEQVDAFDAELAAQAAAPTGETPPEPQAPPEPAQPAPAPAPTEVDWQQKFLTLQGKYNAEVPQLRNQVATLTQQVESIAAPPSTPAQAPAPAAAPPPKLITDEDTETYGTDLIDLIRRVAVETDAGEKERLQAEIADLRQQMAAATKQVESVQGNVEGERRAAYFTELARLCPTYEETDANEAFKAWLLEPDEFSGLIRNDILQQVYGAFDAARTAHIFNTWLAKATPPAPAAPAPQAQVPVSPQAELAAQVSPGQARASTVITPDTDGAKVWSVAEMDAFYKDVARGDYRGRRDEVQRIEAEIDRALAEGRVR